MWPFMRRSTPSERNLLFVFLALALALLGFGLIVVGALAALKLGDEASIRIITLGVLSLFLGVAGVPLSRWLRP
jgi:ABC-type transport system involved in cytochrome c biogenesis permease subunit